MAKKVFVSYSHLKDAHYRLLLQAWDANDSFDSAFDSRGPIVAVDSHDAAVVRSNLTKKAANLLLVLVGGESHESKWMNWEVARGKQNDIRLKLAAVKLSGSNIPTSGTVRLPHIGPRASIAIGSLMGWMLRRTIIDRNGA